MDIQSIKKIIFPAVSNVISKLEEENHEVKVTLLRDIFNEAINDSLNISHTNNTDIKAMFSGRGRAWAKTEVSDENPVWVNIRHTLTNEILYSEPSSNIYKECTNLLDTFESAGFAWMRFGSVSKNNLRFHLRTKGSKLEDHIKVYIDASNLYAGNITNLEGVPHNLGLESGNFLKQIEDLKKKSEVVEYVPLSEKSSNIISIEDLLNEKH